METVELSAEEKVRQYFKPVSTDVLGRTIYELQEEEMGAVFKKRNTTNLQVVEEGETGCYRVISHTGRASSYGHCLVRRKGKMILAHRYVYELFNGAIPKGEGYHGNTVNHACDVPSCINPLHLQLGTQQGNMREMVARGRSSKLKGETNGKSKLSNAESLLVLVADGIQREIAKTFRISQSQVSTIKNGKQRDSISSVLHNNLPVLPRIPLEHIEDARLWAEQISKIYVK
ncbi:hypothetical protein CN383_00080 [Priestia megaterium]|uniref:HNH endonuclease signature motif containing protein n=1 Tax=Priestia megaterium TaxID=1404 RepID=UPI000BF6F777|nr:HNH endonuclease signature motif containing protein [Priestia megaterium]PFB07251.1 hypothetical protein CN383_00080 [Priestia megaterium]